MLRKGASTLPLLSPPECTELSFTKRREVTPATFKRTFTSRKQSANLTVLRTLNHHQVNISSCLLSCVLIFKDNKKRKTQCCLLPHVLLYKQPGWKVGWKVALALALNVRYAPSEHVQRTFQISPEPVLSPGVCALLTEPSLTI